MVLHIARVPPQFLLVLELVLELRKYQLEWFVEDVSERAQPASMSHTEHHVIEVLLGALVHKCSESADECIVPLNAETFAGGELRFQELVESMRPREADKGFILLRLSTIALS